MGLLELIIVILLIVWLTGAFLELRTWSCPLVPRPHRGRTTGFTHDV